jgi:hypothetical protein
MMHMRFHQQLRRFFTCILSLGMLLLPRRRRERADMYSFADEGEMLTWLAVFNKAVAAVVLAEGVTHMQLHDYHGNLLKSSLTRAGSRYNCKRCYVLHCSSWLLPACYVHVRQVWSASPRPVPLGVT